MRIDNNAANNSAVSNIVGEGLLYITGDLPGAGSFQYKELKYVEGDAKITGTPCFVLSWREL